MWQVWESETPMADFGVSGARAFGSLGHLVHSGALGFVLYASSRAFTPMLPQISQSISQKHAPPSSPIPGALTILQSLAWIPEPHLRGLPLTLLPTPSSPSMAPTWFWPSLLPPSSLLPPNPGDPLQSRPCNSQKGNFILFYFNFLKDFTYLFLEGKGGRKRRRETSMCGTPPHTHSGPGPQHRHVP